MATAAARTDEIISTTLDLYTSSTLEDNIFDDIPLFWWLQNKGGRKVSVDGGNNILVPLMYATNSTAASYSGYDTISTLPQTGIGNATYSWKQYAVSITIDGKSLRQNMGREQVVNLLKAKINQAELSVQDVFDTDLFSDGTGNDSKAILGLLAHVAETTTSGTVGGFDRSVETWARNYSASGAQSSSAFDNLLEKMREMYTDTSKGRDVIDLIITHSDVFQGYESLLTADINFNVGMMDNKVGDAGFMNLKYKGAVMMFDDKCASDDMYGLNSKYLKLYVHKGCDFITTPFVKPTNQDAKTAQILWMGELCCSNWSRQGRLYNIS